MNVNAVADEVLNYLNTKFSRVYRNEPPEKIVVNGVKVSLPFPYVIYRIDSVLNSNPSEDLYVNIDIYENVNETVRDIEDLAYLIDNDLNLKVINTDALNLHFSREQRQYVSPKELVSMHLINLRYVVRAYFK